MWWKFTIKQKDKNSENLSSQNWNIYIFFKDSTVNIFAFIACTSLCCHGTLAFVKCWKMVQVKMPMKLALEWNDTFEMLSFETGHYILPIMDFSSCSFLWCCESSPSARSKFFIPPSRGLSAHTILLPSYASHVNSTAAYWSCVAVFYTVHCTSNSKIRTTGL